MPYLWGARLMYTTDTCPNQILAREDSSDDCSPRINSLTEPDVHQVGNQQNWYQVKQGVDPGEQDYRDEDQQIVRVAGTSISTELEDRNQRPNDRDRRINDRVGNRGSMADKDTGSERGQYDKPRAEGDGD